MIGEEWSYLLWKASFTREDLSQKYSWFVVSLSSGMIFPTVILGMYLLNFIAIMDFCVGFSSKQPSWILDTIRHNALWSIYFWQRLQFFSIYTEHLIYIGMRRFWEIISVVHCLIFLAFPVSVSFLCVLLPLFEYVLCFDMEHILLHCKASRALLVFGKQSLPSSFSILRSSDSALCWRTNIDLHFAFNICLLCGALSGWHLLSR